MFDRILVPLDGSQFSGRALPYAMEIAKRFGGEVMLFQVVNPTPLVMSSAGNDAMLSPTATELVIESAREQDKRNIAKAKRYLTIKLREVKARGVSGTYHAVLGDPAKAIIRFCQKESVDLVVMTTSGKSGLKRAFLGSVTDKVVREPGIPVLAVRPKSHRAKK
ncbi:MAG: universal stress protein [Dehalococcoidales bacterium]|nr:universal stress protein [Dehalococcoidales bacterium]